MTRDEVVLLNDAVLEAAEVMARSHELVGSLRERLEDAEDRAREARRKHKAAVDALAKAVPHA